MKQFLLITICVAFFYPQLIAKSDNDHIKSLISQGRKLAKSNPDSSLLILKEVQVLSQEMDNQNVYAEAIFQEAQILRRVYKDYKKALEKYYKVISYFKQQNNLKREALCLKAIGLTYKNSYDYITALEYYFEELTVRSRITNNDLSIADSYYNIGICLRSLEHFDSAIVFQERALQVYEPNDEKVYISKAYIEMGISHMEKGNWDFANQLFHTSIEFANQIDNSKYGYLKAIALNNLGFLSREQGKLSEGKEYYSQALAIKSSNSASDRLATSYNGLAHISLSENDVERAKKYYLASYNLEPKLNEIEWIRACRALHNIAKQNNENSDRIEYGERLNEVYAPLAERALALEKMHATYRVRAIYDEQKRKELLSAVRAQRFKITLGVAALAILLLVLFYYLYRLNKKHNKDKKFIDNHLSQYIEIAKDLGRW